MCVAKLLLSRTMNKLFYVWFIQEILRKYAEAIFFFSEIHTKSITKLYCNEF